VRSAALLIVVAIAAASSPVVAQQRYVRAEETPDHRLIITTATGEQIVLAKAPALEFEREHVQFGDIAISPDGLAVGWLAYFGNCCTSYPIPLRVEAFTNGQRKTFAAAIAAWDWCFVDGSAKIAALSSTVHGPQNQVLELWDVASLKKIDEFRWMQDEDHPRAPEWVLALKGDYKKQDTDRTHICSTARR
jgi:hypothetical protein